ncbi:hypothetical protein HPB48_007367 [Haemaphysalis longicornis]|uniref:Cuticle protein n=1 Tax=Haemaphysalis longicornis TaxID=44386 RepID=A0A9J6G6Y9_HAELO|nr:hypothetical protein HPB48_007367 [Haemaphysalis longicornis]
MFAKVLLCCLAAIAASATVEQYPPQPYSFSYDNTDEFGTRLTREETGDENNYKVGSYSYVDATGITRTVRYTADATGFHATVETNEPGTKTSSPADALYSSSAVEVAPVPTPVVAKPVTVVAARPVAVAPVKAVPVAAVKPVAVAAVRPYPVAAVHAGPVPVVHTVHASPYSTVGVHPVSFCAASAAIAASATVEQYPPQPYSFSYDNTDEFGTRLTREETGDENNYKVGSYSYVDATGITRTVRYTADATGFHATVETNEPGTKTSSPADALYSSSAVEVAPAPTPVVAKPVTIVAARPVAVAPVKAVPVAVTPVKAVPCQWCTPSTRRPTLPWEVIPSTATA